MSRSLFLQKQCLHHITRLLFNSPPHLIDPQELSHYVFLFLQLSWRLQDIDAIQSALASLKALCIQPSSELQTLLHYFTVAPPQPSHL